MKSAILAVAFLAAAVSAQPTINTPTVSNAAAECQPFLLSWSGGTPPWFVTIQTNPIGTSAVADFGQTSATSATWIVNATVGSSLLFQIKDSTGASASSAPFQVVTGSGDSCLKAGGGSAGVGGTTAAGATTAAGTTAGSAPAGGATTAAGTTSKAASGSSTSSKASTTPGAATKLSVPAGVLPACAAVLGAALVALVA
ncbi:hypothetical protein B0H15DRAFT_808756 [Mycena belliarum]|uniref:Uncharacterized protein n=1 Tax=Mycena belliarum TaxID=1033014 RepID=A0AAD6UJA5_9AGAR|nr:hypothetical protein B0H15DRAFT_808756 [Mycena belliae]